MDCFSCIDSSGARFLLRRVVASVGDPNILPNGTEQECLVKAGDRVLLSREKGYAELGGFVIIDQECVMAILDKEVEVS